VSDKLGVYKLDRLARSTYDLHKIAKELKNRGISLLFIKEQIDFQLLLKSSYLPC
jgi:DNA invertase Pin-like site-specific DNA recombinase